MLDVRKYGAHSTRAASTSAAKTVNISIQSIMDVAGWSNAETFRSSKTNPWTLRLALLELNYCMQ